MKLITTLLFIFIVGSVYSQVVPHDLLPPPPQNAFPISDNAHLLSTSEINQLSHKLSAYNDSTSNQIVIVTVSTLHGYEPDQFATELGHYWGVGGQAKKDNGVIILISDGKEENNKRKVFIATGYGLEGALPAITCKKIVSYDMIPNLKSGQYYLALDNAINSIIKAAAGEYTAPDGYKKSNNKSSWKEVFLFFFIIFIVLFILYNKNKGGNDGYHTDNSWWILPTILGSGGGYDGGGGSSSSDSGGGGDFGSFGGGDFGGGGSGGDW